jgi:hypothetical protein
MQRHYSTKEAARYLNLSPQTLTNWRCLGRGPRFLKFGGRVVYDHDDLQAFKNSSVFQNTRQSVVQ